MFGLFETKEASSLLVAEPIDLRSEDVEIELEHRRLSEKLGVLAKPEVAWRKLAAVLADEMIPVYDLSKVTAFMNSKARKEQKVWYWYPLRVTDVPQTSPRSASEARPQLTNQGMGGQMASFGWAAAHLQAAQNMFGVEYVSNGGFQFVRYSEAVPLPVLLTVERLADRIGDDAEFFVAALGGPIDPFLGIRLKSDPAHTLFVVERWDEPGFRG